MGPLLGCRRWESGLRRPQNSELAAERLTIRDDFLPPILNSVRLSPLPLVINLPQFELPPILVFVDEVTDPQVVLLFFFLLHMCAAVK
jgi:hypothetical protein